MAAALSSTIIPQISSLHSQAHFSLLKVEEVVFEA